MIRTGLVGGTFDPIHRGHTALIKAALDSDRLDRVIVMPAGRPPHKEQQRVLPASYRLAMTEKAFSGLDGITVSNLEISQKRRSYTIDTIRRLRPYLPDSSELVLVYGSDILLDLEHWYHPEEVLNECKLLLARRGGYDAVEAERLAAMFRQRYGARIEFFDCPQIDLSSSEIRQAISSGRPWKANVPKAVAALIEKHGLYRYESEWMDVPGDVWQMMLDIEQQLIPLLSRGRLLHSLNVALYALHLARCHGLDERQTLTAGLLHDSAKCLQPRRQAELAARAGDPNLLTEDLMHAPAGSVLAREQFGIEDPQVLKAILCHTTGCPRMSPLDQIIYLADKIEPSRPFDDLEPLRRMAEVDLPAAMHLCLQEIEAALKRDGQPLHPYSKALLYTSEA